MTDAMDPGYFCDLCRTASVGIVATDESLVIRFCNAAAIDILALREDQLIGQQLTFVMPVKRHEVAQRMLERLLQTGEPAEVEFRYTRGDEQSINLAVSVSPVRNEQGAIIGVCAHLRDTTNHVALLRDIAQAQKMASLESMAGAVAHHFNNILGGAITTADFALASDDPDMHKRTLGITVAALSRANELTQGLLSFAEGEHTDLLSIDLYDTVKRYLAGMDRTLQQRAIRLETNLVQVGAVVPAKPIMLVLDRLIGNAIEAMPNGGTITVELRLGGDEQAVLRIADDGAGIAEHHLSRIFEPFFTTKQPERIRPTDHPGLGLAVVHGIVKGLGGTITVTSAPEHGTAFTIRLPRRPPA